MLIPIEERAPDAAQVKSVAQVLDMSTDEVEQIYKAIDPDPKFSNSRWLLKQIKLGNLDVREPARGSFPAIKQTLQKFTDAKKAKALKGNEANLDSYKSFNDLTQKLQELPATALVSKRAVKRGKADPLAVEGSELVQSSPNWRIYHLASQDAMALHGKGTTWCTRVKGGEYQCRYIGRGGTYAIYKKRTGPGVAPVAVLSDKMPGWELVGQYTPTFSEVRDTQNTEIRPNWFAMADPNDELKSLMLKTGKPNAAQRFFAREAPPGEEPDDEEAMSWEDVMAAIGDETWERIQWAYGHGYSVVDDDGHSIRTARFAARSVAEDTGAWVEHHDLSSTDDIVNQSNVRSFWRDHRGDNGVRERGAGIEVSVTAGEEAWDGMTGLEDYPVYDEMALSELEEEYKERAWDETYHHDFIDALETAEHLEDDEEALEWIEELRGWSDKSNELFNDTYQKEYGDYPDWENEGSYMTLRPVYDRERRTSFPAVEVVADVVDRDELMKYGDPEQYEKKMASERAQMRQFPTGEPPERMGPVVGQESVQEGEGHSYATTQAVLPDDVTKKVLDLRNQIDPDDLHPEEGFGPDPHVTILYGLGDDQHDVAVEIMQRADPIRGTIQQVDLFQNDDYDVVILPVESEDLQRLHQQLDELPNDNEYPDYRPHITIAYVKSGVGEKYQGLKNDLENQKFVAHQVEFSNTSDDKTVVDLREGATVAFDRIPEQSPLFGVDLTEEPDFDAEIAASLYSVLNRANRRIASVEPEGAGASVLLDSGVKVQMEPAAGTEGDWLAIYRGRRYDPNSPSDVESLVKQLRSLPVEEGRMNLSEAKVDISQEGSDLIFHFSEIPQYRKTPVAGSEVRFDPKGKKLKPEKRVPGDLRQETERYSWIDEIFPQLEEDFGKYGKFRKITIDSIRFSPYKRDWKELENLLDDTNPKGFVQWFGRKGVRATGLGSGQELKKPGLLKRAVRAVPGVKSLFLGDAVEDTYTSDVATTDTIPITTGGKKKVKLPGLGQAGRQRQRRVRRIYNRIGESISKRQQPIILVMRANQVTALDDKPVWSALRESGVVNTKLFKMGTDEFFEVRIDTLRKEWDQANASALLDEVGAVSPQAQRKIIERVAPRDAVSTVVKLIIEDMRARAETSLEEGVDRKLADWIRERKLAGVKVDADKLALKMLSEGKLVDEVVESYAVSADILQLLQSIENYPSIAAAAKRLTEERTDTGANLGTTADPSGAGLGGEVTGYSEQDDQPPGGPQMAKPTVSSRTWETGAMFKLHVQAGDQPAWVYREVVGSEGEGEDSRLVYKTPEGRVMSLPHQQIDDAMGFGAVVSPDEMGAEGPQSKAGYPEVPTVAPEPSPEPMPTAKPESVEEQDTSTGPGVDDAQAQLLQRNNEFTRALTKYQQSKDERDWEEVRQTAERATGKTGPELDEILAAFAPENTQEDVLVKLDGTPVVERNLPAQSGDKPCRWCGAPAVQIENGVCMNCKRKQEPVKGKTESEEVEAAAIKRFAKDEEFNSLLNRFDRTKNEGYLLRAADRAARVALISTSDAQRLVDELVEASKSR